MKREATDSPSIESGLRDFKNNIIATDSQIIIKKEGRQ